MNGFLCGILSLFIPGQLQTPEFDQPPAGYIRPVTRNVQLIPLLTVGQAVPLTGNPTKSFRLVGVPDGMGIVKTGGELHLYVNHELSAATRSLPLPGGDTLSGAFVSLYLLDPDTPLVRSGSLGFDPGRAGGGFGLSPDTLSRLCSGSLAGAREGFDRAVWLTGEEVSDGRGVAVMGGHYYLLPGTGRFRKENLCAAPAAVGETVLFALEDGPAGLVSQLYMYVGAKQPGSTNPLVKNGLIGGSLYVFRSTGPELDERDFHKEDGVMQGEWVELPGADTLTEEGLEALAQSIGAFGFYRVEDGCFDKNRKGRFYFAATGGSYTDTTLGNGSGRVYRLTFNPSDPAGSPAALEVILEGDRGDPLLSPDNLDTSPDGKLLICEDVTAGNRPLLAGREASVWQYDLFTGELVRLAEIDQRAAPAQGQGSPGEWESSGVVDASAVYGPGSWLVNVQAHTYTNPNSDPLLVEGGQLLLLKTW